MSLYQIANKVARTQLGREHRQALRQSQLRTLIIGELFDLTSRVHELRSEIAGDNSCDLFRGTDWILHITWKVAWNDGKLEDRIWVEHSNGQALGSPLPGEHNGGVVSCYYPKLSMVWRDIGELLGCWLPALLVKR